MRNLIGKAKTRLREEMCNMELLKLRRNFYSGNLNQLIDDSDKPDMLYTPVDYNEDFADVPFNEKISDATERVSQIANCTKEEERLIERMIGKKIMT